MEVNSTLGILARCGALCSKTLLIRHTRVEVSPHRLALSTAPKGTTRLTQKGPPCSRRNLSGSKGASTLLLGVCVKYIIALRMRLWIGNRGLLLSAVSAG